LLLGGPCSLSGGSEGLLGGMGNIGGTNMHFMKFASGSRGGFIFSFLGRSWDLLEWSWEVLGRSWELLGCY